MSMKQDESQKKPIGASPTYPPLKPTPGMTPEQQAVAMDKFHKGIGQALVDNLNKNVREGYLTK